MTACLCVQRMAEMLEDNTTLTSLSMWRANLNEQAGNALIGGLAHNTSIVFLELGNNYITMRDETRMAQLLARNMDLHRQDQAVQAAEAKHQAELDVERRAAQDVERKKEEVSKWMDEQKRLRVEGRRAVYEEERLRFDKIRAEREEQRRIAQEAKEAAEAAAAKKKGKGKKKK